MSKKVLIVDGEAQQGRNTLRQIVSMLARVGLGEADFELAEAFNWQAKPRDAYGCILTLGQAGIDAVQPMPFDRPHLDNRRGYVEWNQQVEAWVIPTYHPGYIAYGNQKLTGVWLNDFQHALQICSDGYQPLKILTLEDPTPMEFLQWVNEYEQQLVADPETILSYDIETLGKQSKAEDDLELSDPSYEITRIGFAWNPDAAVSIPWQAPYLPGVLRLMASRGIKLGWNTSYDRPRVQAQGIEINGPQHDGMWAWHVANSDLDKGLGFVATFHAWDQQRWKHLSHVNQAYYNALDAAVTLKIYLGVKRDLQQLRLWDIYLRHVCELDQHVLWPMTATGVLIDNVKRQEASEQLQAQLIEIQRRMEAEIPLEARKLKVYKQEKAARAALEAEPGSQLIEVPSTKMIQVCPLCGEQGIKRDHLTRKTVADANAEKGKRPNPCLGQPMSVQEIASNDWGVTQPFRPSQAQLIQYQQAVNHMPIMSKEKRPTFDDDAIRKLIKAHPQDPLYPLVVEYRNTEKILSTYVGYWDGERWTGGLGVGADGRIHATYLHNPSTLRLSSQNPNVQVWPRGRTPEAKLVKQLVVAAPGHVLVEIDYSAIEAVLVGYFANSPSYMRLAKLGIHDYVLSHMLYRAKEIPAPADLTLSDVDLKLFYKDLKKRYNPVRDVAKRVVHMTNYGGTPQRMNQANPESFPTVKAARELQALYLDVCPEIKQWQEHTVALADRTGYLVNPFGYIHRFWTAKVWKKDPAGEWVATWGEDAKRCLAFLPQSTAAGIIKEAMLRLRHTALMPHLRLQVHDSLLCEIPEEEVNQMLELLEVTLQEPSPYLPLNPQWGLGDFLNVGTETKLGSDWGHMKEWTR